VSSDRSAQASQLSRRRELQYRVAGATPRVLIELFVFIAVIP
jgi:hypothetical protein